MTPRPGTLRYVGLDVEPARLRAHYDLDGRAFTEVVTLEGTGDLTGASARAIATLWYLIAGLSYYKTAAPGRVDLGTTPVGPRALALLRAAIVDGLGEFAYRNALDLSDVDVVGAAAATPAPIELDPTRVLTPFGGGIDSIVTVETLADDLDQALFVVSPDRGRFAALEAAAAATGRPVVRATRSLDPSLLAGDPAFLRGHVPVTAMVTLLGALAAVASGRGGVVMKTHLSHSPHQAPARLAGSWVKARLQLRKTWWYAVSSLKRRATQSSLRSRRKLATASDGPTASVMASPISTSAAQDLLHWWLTSRPRHERLATDAECSLLITTPPRPLATAASAPSRVTIAVTGT